MFYMEKFVMQIKSPQTKSASVFSLFPIEWKDFRWKSFEDEKLCKARQAALYGNLRKAFVEDLFVSELRQTFSSIPPSPHDCNDFS